MNKIKTKEIITKTQAREYFINKKLFYKKISSVELYMLYNILKKSLEEHSLKLSTHWIKMKPINRLLIKYDDEGYLKSAKLNCKGSWFCEREAITFSDTGFIGFCVWADQQNEKPFINSFIEWCDIIGEKI